MQYKLKQVKGREEEGNNKRKMQNKRKQSRSTIIAVIIRMKGIRFQHLGESGSMTYGSVRVVMTSEKKGMT